MAASTSHQAGTEFVHARRRDRRRRRRLPAAQAAVPGYEPFEGRHIHYACEPAEAFRGQDLVIFGGGDSALDWALAQPIGRSVTLVHRSPEFRAAPASVAKMRELVRRARRCSS
jgi:thioredoxin reductase